LKSEFKTELKSIINEGKNESENTTVINALKKGFNIEQIADIMNLPLEKVQTIIKVYLTLQIMYDRTPEGVKKKDYRLSISKMYGKDILG
jgi:pimeloyl-CoA synthetase